MKLENNNYGPNINSLISSDFPRYLISEGVIHKANNVLGEKFTTLLLS